MAEKNKDDGRAFELKRAARDGDDDRREHATDRLSASGSSGAAEFDFLPAHLRRKYYVVEVDATEARIYADRDGEYLIAKAGRDRLVTLVANVEIVRDLVAIAAHRGWERIELTGSLEFRREAWLAASARGIETKGYEPSELDRAALAKMQGRFEHDQQPCLRPRPERAQERRLGARRQPSGIRMAERTTATPARISPSSSASHLRPSPKTPKRASAFSTWRANGWRIIAVVALASIGRKSSREKPSSRGSRQRSPLEEPEMPIAQSAPIGIDNARHAGRCGSRVDI